MVRPYASYHGIPIPCVDAHEMRRIDQIMADDYGIGLAQMAESAGPALAALALRMLRGCKGLPVVVLAGKCGNGSGALVAARRLAAWGFTVQVVLSEAGLAEPSRTLRATLDSMDIPVTAYAASDGQRVEEEIGSARSSSMGSSGTACRASPTGVSLSLSDSRMRLRASCRWMCPLAWTPRLACRGTRRYGQRRR